MEQVMGVLLGSLQMFYPLLVLTAIAFAIGLFRRSWPWMLASAILIFPGAWYVGATPRFPWATFVPLVPILLAVWFFLLKKRTA
jgi:hypothetical protein